jgi:hypothetical protein
MRFLHWLASFDPTGILGIALALAEGKTITDLVYEIINEPPK